VSSPFPSSAGRLLDLVETTWPRFVLLRDCVIRDRPDVDEAFEQWWDIHQDEPWHIENAMNHVHLYDFVGDDYDDSELPMLERAAEHIAEAWRAALGVQFPEHNLEVTIATEPDEYGPTVSCHRRAS
jgi:hypothetical protein